MNQVTFLDVICVLSFRFFFFDFKKFKKIRDILNSTNNYIICELLRCSFCQGFWSGLIYYLIRYGFDLDAILFGFSTAFLSFTWYSCTDNLIRIMENEHK